MSRLSQRYLLAGGVAVAMVSSMRVCPGCGWWEGIELLAGEHSHPLTAFPRPLHSHSSAGMDNGEVAACIGMLRTPLAR